MIETLPFFESIYVHSKKDRRNVTTQDLRLEIDIFGNTSPLAILLIIDHSCNLFFLCELMVKLIAAPYKKQFLISPQTIVEFVCLIPYYIAIIIVFYHPEPKNIFDLIRFMMSLRVLRIFRLFILMKHFLALKILMYTIRASTKELFLLLLVVLIGVVIFACIVYYMEMFSDQETQFEHIPMACWWALVTMTTVGYGDMVPSTGQGYAAGAVCALCGVLVIALSVPAIVQNFTLYYTHAQSRLKLKQRKRIYRRKKWSNLRNLLKDSDPSKNAFARIVSLAREENKKRRKSAAVAPFTQNKDSADKPVTKRGRSHSVAAAVSKRDVSGIFKRLAKTPNGNAKVQNTEETKPAAEKLDFTQSSKDLAKQSTSSGDVGNEKTPEIPKTSKVEENEKVLDKQKDDTSTPVPKVKPICNNIPSISVNSETSEKKALPTLKEETNEETNDNFVSEKSSMYSFNFSRTSSFSNDSVIQEKSEKAKSRSRASSLSDRSYDSDMSDTELSMEFDKTVKSKSITAKDVWSRFMKKQNV
ncbi:hypothetical protein FSP39_003571 [Pinctada imbricata]|uniref:Ion transport domain-containing protein n=1 Tax=Pinctada imbricata TaxID=66713 RepID=A0AA89BJX0_PINIB|nr:hypothetical protein FSP39_003571 [Pinctada imbricata]